MAEIFRFPLFNAGIISDTAIARDVVNEQFPNSVRRAFNIDFYSRLGYARVRRGTERIGGNISGSSVPLGISELTTATLNRPVVVYDESGSAQFYYYEPSTDTWTASSGFPTNNGIARFAQLGRRLYVTTQTKMHSTTDGSSWTTDVNEGNIQNTDISHITAFRSRLLAVDTDNNPDRVYISTIIDLNNTPILEWDTDPNTGRWIDVSPDDGGRITGFATAGTKKLIFKNNGLYLYDAPTTGVSADNLSDTGAYSQEAITEARGYAYFVSPEKELYRTNGGYPEDIGRPIQDLLDSIPNLDLVSLASDQRNVYIYVGDSLQLDLNLFISNPVFVYSIRDEAFSLYSFPYHSRLILTQNRNFGLYAATAQGNVVSLEKENRGYDDDQGTDRGIGYYLQTQEQDISSRGDIKQTAPDMYVYGEATAGSSVELESNVGSYPKQQKVDYPIDREDNMEKQGNWFRLVWRGVRNGGDAPVFEGAEFEYSLKGSENEPTEPQQ